MITCLPIRLALCACAFTAAVAHATDLPVPTVEYSADRTVETDAGTLEGRIYSAMEKERIETSMHGIENVMILRRDRQAGWMLMPAQRMYQEVDLARAEEQSGMQSSDKADITVVGPETVEGQAATKYKMVMKDGSGGGFIWITADGITVKMDLLGKSGGDKTRMTVTLKNIVIGAQDPGLFELPEGYKAMPSFGGLGGFVKPGTLRDAGARLFNR
jgi:hypothetical protein